MPRYPSRYSSQSSFSFGPGPISTAIKIIIGVNVAVFVAGYILPSLWVQESTKILGLVPTFVVDERVTHDKYGLGRVVSVESDVAVVVDFGSLQVRLTRPFDKLSTL